MKYLAIIFSLYMALLTLMPCQDKEDFSGANTNVSTIGKQAKGVEHTGLETCPPFCTCSCCSVSRDFIPSKTFGVVVYQVQPQYAEYRMPVIAEQILEIYQPPQIA
ncbi:MAG: DUF6660 family protein [Pedobacter sp.]|jgi:hypothetical protein|uniref:DUF6660 family protein n=1 Tax=Pedobacter sp. TaxID=1411316 RepID=UPI003562D224